MPGESRLGVALARIATDLSGFSRGREVVVRESRVMTGAVEGIGRAADNLERQTGNALSKIANHFRQAEEAAQRFANSDLGVIQRGLQETAGKFAAISAAAGAFVALGTASAQNVTRLNGLFTVLSGSQQKANERMNQLRQYADRTGQSFLSVAEGALAILPAVGRNNVDLEKTLGLVQRLAVLDPAQGIEGAAFALREILGGSYTSLAARFELPKTKLKELVDSAKGSPQAIVDALSTMVDQMGLTSEAMEEMGKSGINAFSKTQGAIQEALATAFTPLRQDVILPLVGKIGDFVNELNRTNPELLKLVSVFAVAAAGAAPLLLALSQLITAYKTLKGLTSGGLGGAIGKVAVGGAALEIGNRLGLGLVKELSKVSDVGDLKRIRAGEDPGAVVGERLKQGIVIITSVLLDGFKLVAQIMAAGANAIKQGFELVTSIFKLGGGLIQQVIGKLVEAIGNVLAWIADNFSGLFDTSGIRAAGQGLQLSGLDTQAQGFQQQREAQDRLARGLDFGEIRAAADGVGATLDDVKKTVLGGLVGLLFPAQEAADNLEEAADKVQDAVEKVGGITFSDEQLAAFGEFQDNLKALQDKFSEQRLKEEEAYQEQLSDIFANRQRRDKRAAEDQAIADRNRQRAFNKQLEGIDKQRDENLANAAKERDDKIKEIEDKSNEQRLQREAQFQSDRQKAEEQHRLNLIQAASKLDAIAVANELRNYALKQQQDQQKFTEDQQKAQEQKQQEIAAAEQAFQERLTREREFADKQKAEAEAQFKEQLAAEAEMRALRAQRQAEDDALELERLATNHAKRLAELDNQQKKETDQLEQAFIKTFNKLAQDAGQHQNNMIAIQQRGQQELEKGLLEFWKRANAQAAANLPSGGSTTPSGGSGGTSGTYTKTGGSVVNTGGNILGGLRVLRGFASAGSVPRTGAYNLEGGEYVMKPSTAAFLQRMLGSGLNDNSLMRAVAGGGTGRGDVSIGSIPININMGDTGGRSDREIASLVHNAAQEAIINFFRST